VLSLHNLILWSDTNIVSQCLKTFSKNQSQLLQKLVKDSEKSFPKFITQNFPKDVLSVPFNAFI